jgi:hypothetical protein
MKKLSLALLVLSAPAFAKYDPDSDRAALRQAASSSYDAAGRAAAVPLVPERAAEIRADLDESLAQANLAANDAKNLETGASNRADEMSGELKGRGAPAPSSAAKDLAGAAASARTRWMALSKDRDGLKARVDVLPDANKDKAELKTLLERSSASLAAADEALTHAESAATAMAAGVAAMALAQKRAKASAAELAAADAEVIRRTDLLSPPVADAKAATALLGQEPQGENRTRAGQKISIPRDVTGLLYSAADRACNRADDYRSRSDAFGRAQAAFTSAQGDGSALDAAKPALDDADGTQAGVRDRLDHPKPRP